MKKFIKRTLSIGLCAVLVFSLSSCEEAKNYEDGYSDGYVDGHFYASEELSEHSFEMYQKGYDEAYGDFVYAVIEDEAVHYAVEHGGWHPEEAMCIIDAYEKNEGPYADLLISEKDYKDAIQSLCCYYEYFYNAMYKDDVECDYDDYEYYD